MNKLYAYLNKNNPKVLLIFATTLLFFYLRTVPYFGIVFNDYSIFLLLFLEAIIVLKIGGNVSFILGLIFLAITVLILVFGLFQISEQFSIIAFGLIIIGSIQFLFEYFDSKHTN